MQLAEAQPYSVLVTETQAKSVPPAVSEQSLSPAPHCLSWSASGETTSSQAAATTPRPTIVRQNLGLDGRIDRWGSLERRVEP